MTSKSEQLVSRCLRETLAGLPIGARIADTENIRDVLSGLEWFVGQILGEVYAEWKRESLDGIYPLVAQKTGDGEAEIFGLCIIISDQSLVPLHLQLQLAPSGHEVSWLECRLGERGEQGMERTPYGLKSLDKMLNRFQGRADTIDWAYNVTFGDRRA